jgi:hypothetical protein
MAKQTQAHLTRTFKKDQSSAALDQLKNKMDYYMGAKLMEIGVNPKSAVYRWSVSTKGEEISWTLSAYWDEDREKLLSGKIPLTGTDLIDCARANASSGLETATKLCGYGEDVRGFEGALKQACSDLGLHIESLKELMSNIPYLKGHQGVEVTPNTNSSL